MHGSECFTYAVCGIIPFSQQGRREGVGLVKTCTEIKLKDNNAMDGLRKLFVYIGGTAHDRTLKTTAKMI